MKHILTLLMLSAFVFSFSQENKKAEDIFGLKVGLIGGWISYEKALNDNFTVEAEVGYFGGFFKGTNSKLDYAFTSSIRLQPKYYYNFNRRQERGKNTNNNSANFIATEIYYIPDFLTSTNRDNINIVESFGIVPKYGLRRSISENLIFEFAAGVGYSWGENNNNGAIPALDLRLHWKL